MSAASSARRARVVDHLARAAVVFQPGGRPLVCELYLGRTRMPWWGRQAWRWDLTWQRVDDRERWTRWHVASDFGYARTRAGAWRAVRRAYAARTSLYAGRHDQDDRQAGDP
jgi:hypothetical protein